MRRATIKDLANRVGLSTSTVGRALANQGQVDAETRRRVLSAATEMGYVAHSGARLMRAGAASMVGLIIPDIQNEFYATVAKAMAECCNDQGLQLVLAVTEDDADQELSQVRALVEARASGIVIVPSQRPNAAIYALLDQQPAVQFIRRDDKLKGDWFGIDEAHALSLGVEHLAKLGHRRIAFVGPPLTTSTGRERMEGYRNAVLAAGATFDDALVRTGPPRVDDARQAALDFLAGPDPPSAIIAGGSRVTLGIVQAVEALALSVPEDISLIGYGDAPWYAWYRKGLTTISLPVRDVALNCGSFLIRRIDGNRKNIAPDDRAFQSASKAVLEIRGSTARPAGAALATGPTPGTG